MDSHCSIKVHRLAGRVWPRQDLVVSDSVWSHLAISHASSLLKPFKRAFYSSQTMVNNLGFTLTPDSMITFKDATWPILLMTFLAFAGNTCYPVVLRFCLWVTYKLTPSNKPNKAALKFLLDHPRRCYTLLFPSHPTWILFGIIAALNFVDVLLIIVLDLDNPAVNDLPMGPRILSALFQAASSRHTGTSTLNLAEINPAVQFSLLVMMYIAILPIAISIRQCHPYLFIAPLPLLDHGLDCLRVQTSGRWLLTHSQARPTPTRSRPSGCTQQTAPTTSPGPPATS